MPRRVTCPYCGYTWETRSTHVFVSCPSCLKKVRTGTSPREAQQPQQPAAQPQPIASLPAAPRPTAQPQLASPVPVLRESYAFVCPFCGERLPGPGFEEAVRAGERHLIVSHSKWMNAIELRRYVRFVGV